MQRADRSPTPTEATGLRHPTDSEVEEPHGVVAENRFLLVAGQVYRTLTSRAGCSYPRGNGSSEPSITWSPPVRTWEKAPRAYGSGPGVAVTG